MKKSPPILRARRLLAAALSLFAPLTLQAADLTGSYEWKPIKIGGGGFVTGVVSHPTTADLTYCRTDVGGAFRWNASTSSWVRLTTASGMPAAFRSWEYYNTESMAVDKLNSQVVYMAAGAQNPRSNVTPAGAVFKSTNRGQTWTVAGSQRWKIAGNGHDREGGERLAVDPANSSVVYFGSRVEGLWRSLDGGGSWSQIPTSKIPLGTWPSGTRTPGGVKLVTFDPSGGLVNGRTAIVYVGVAGEGLYKSTDAGENFTKVHTSTKLPFDIEVVNNGVVWLTYSAAGAGGGGAVVVFNPATNTWNTCTPTGDSSFAIAVDPFDNNRIFVGCGAISDGKFARSLNGVNTQYWTFLQIAVSFPDIQWPAATDEENFMSIGDIKFDPLVQNRMWFAQGIGMWRTSDLADSETTWTFISQGIEEFIGEDVIVTPSGQLISAVADRLGFRHTSPDTYATQTMIASYFSSLWSLDWTPANGSFVAAVESDVRAGSNDNRDVWTSTNNGQDWVKKTNPANMEGGEIAISATSTQNMVRIGTGTLNPRVTLDGGSTWIELTYFGANKSFRDNVWWSHRRALAADRVDGGVFYLHLPSGNGDFYRSSNSGQTWELAPGDIPTGYGDGNQFTQIEAVPGRAGHVWGCFNQGGIHYTTNKGTSWTKVNFFNYARAIGFGKELTSGGYPAVYVWGNTTTDTTYAIYRSGDQGASWDKIAAYPLDIFDSIPRVTGDLQTAGKVYITCGGQGLAYGQPVGSAGGTGSITRDVWSSVPGTAIADIPVTTTPTSTSTLTSFEAPSNVADNYGQSIDGFLHPPTTGSYTFWIAGDDSVELSLSTDQTPANAVTIAYHNDWTNSREWGKLASQKSAPISLVAGQKYYIEALMKEGTRGDNLAVAWRLNNTTTPANGDGSVIIPGSALSPWTGGSTLPTITYETVDPPAASSGDIHRVFSETTASGGACAVLEGNAVGDYVTYAATGVQAATYKIYVRHKVGTNRAQVQLATSSSLTGTYTNRGGAVYYGTTNSYVETLVNTAALSAGTNYFRFTASGKNASSTGYLMPVDRIRLEPQ